MLIGKKEILFAVDGSECSFNAVDAAIKLLNTQNTALTVINVQQGMENLPAEILSDKEWLEKTSVRQQKNADEAIQRAIKLLEQHGLKAETQAILKGEPALEIVKYAREHKKDLIVVGSHGREWFAAMLLGSVSRKILETAHCPVLVVPTCVVPRSPG